MKDICKTVNYIKNKPVTVKKTHKKGYYIRKVDRIVGIIATVYSQDAPDEPVGKYATWLNNIGEAIEIDSAQREGKTVKVTIEQDECFRWNVTDYESIEPEPENTLTEQKAESKGLCDQY